jgi:hypothetical protein
MTGIVRDRVGGRARRKPCGTTHLAGGHGTAAREGELCLAQAASRSPIAVAG